jgi:hypothetical protein
MATQAPLLYDAHGRIWDDKKGDFAQPDALTKAENDKHTVKQSRLKEILQHHKTYPKHNADGSDLLTQDAIDLERAKVILNILEGIIRHDEWDTLKKPRYLWWRSRKIEDYELRDGNPPSNTDRPVWLRHRRLELDLGIIPDWIKYALYPESTVDTAIKESLDKGNVMANEVNVIKMRQLVKHHIAGLVRDQFLKTRKALN